MGDVAQLNSEQENLRKIRARLLQWDAKDSPLAPLTPQQIDSVDVFTQKWKEVFEKSHQQSSDEPEPVNETPKDVTTTCESLKELQVNATEIEKTNDFLTHFDRVHEEIYSHADGVYHKYLNQLKVRRGECEEILEEIDTAIGKLANLQEEYDFVSNKTSALNSASEKLTEEQGILHEMSEEIQKRLHFFNQVETLSQRLQSPTMSVSSDAFKDCLNRIDECLEYLRAYPKFKESGIYTVKYRNHCLSKALTLIRNYVTNVLSQATSQILPPSKPQTEASLSSNSNSDAAFALYYGKFQTSAIKIKRVSTMVEERVGKFPEYDQLLSDIHHNYLTERASIMSPAVDKAFKDLVKVSKANSKGDYCTLMRSACAFLAHVCQDEHRLFYQFFSIESDQLNTYLDGLCTLLYDTIRPYIIHINHLETLAEICCILRIEMIEEHVQQNPEQLGSFGKTANQLLQDVQERLVFRAYLYLQSDILNYNPSPGDLAYPQKLEMMESIALSLQEPILKRSDSRSSMISSASSVFQDNESVVDARSRTLNSPADLHGMWYPTVRRTLVCLSRLYRCVDRPIFQGLSQEALKYCIESVSKASAKISAARTPIDGELFEIKHLLILREQIAPFRVDFTVKETSLDFSKVKTAAFGLLQKRKQLFSMNSNNALLEFLLDGTPQVKEQLLDSRKDVDRQLKAVCELFIKNSVQMFVGPILQFLEKAQGIVSTEQPQQPQQKVNYALRQSAWASPQQISVIVQESQRLIKSKLSGLQRSMQLYLSNRDTEFIIFKPIRNNIIGAFSKLEQVLTSNGYTTDDMIMTSCPSAEQVSILLSSASILATEHLRKISTSSMESGSAASYRKISVAEKKVSFDSPVITETLEVESEKGDSIEVELKKTEKDEVSPEVKIESYVEPPTV